MLVYGSTDYWKQSEIVSKSNLWNKENKKLSELLFICICICERKAEYTTFF